MTGPFPQPGQASPPVSAALSAEVAACSADPANQFGGYVLLSEVGRGPKTVVMRAWEAAFSRLVAIKFVHEDRFPDETRRGALFDRLGHAMRVRHPGIAPVLNLAQTAEGRPYIVSEHVDGESLRARLRRGISPRETATLLRHVAVTLDAIHVQNVVHGGLRPENIIIDRTDGAPRITDCGTCATAADDAVFGNPADAVEAPLYFAPEQAYPTGQAMAVSDVFALGAILYEAICGQAPFFFRGAPTPTEIALALSRPPAPPRALDPSLPEALEATILHCLAVNPASRPASVGEVAGALGRLIAQGTLGEMPVRPRPLAPPPAAAPPPEPEPVPAPERAPEPSPASRQEGRAPREIKASRHQNDPEEVEALRQAIAKDAAPPAAAKGPRVIVASRPATGKATRPDAVEPDAPAEPKRPPAGDDALRRAIEQAVQTETKKTDRRLVTSTPKKTGRALEATEKKGADRALDAAGPAKEDSDAIRESARLALHAVQVAETRRITSRGLAVAAAGGPPTGRRGLATVIALLVVVVAGGISAYQLLGPFGPKPNAPIGPLGVALEAPADGLVARERVPVRGVLTRPGVTLTIGGQRVPMLESRFSAAMKLPDGTHQLVASADGEKDVVLATVEVDATPPAFELRTPREGQVIGPQGLELAIEGRVREAHPAELTVAGRSVTAAAGGAFKTSLRLPTQAGPVQIELAARDQLGNEGRQTITVVVDLESPAIEMVTSPAESVSTSTAVTLRGRIIDRHPKQVRVDGRPAALNSDGTFEARVTVGEQEGERTVAIEGEDAAGNVSTTVSHRIAYDLTPPALTLTAPADGAVIAAPSARIQGVLEDANLPPSIDAVASVPLDPTIRNAPSYQADVPVAPDGTVDGQVPLAEGTNVLVIRATDLAGNQVEQKLVVVRDTRAPSFALKPAPPAVIQGDGPRKITLTGRLSEEGCSVSVNRKPATVDRTKFEATVDLTRGENRFEIVAVDRAGNQLKRVVTVRYEPKA